jgi:hypothetical protein
LNEDKDFIYNVDPLLDAERNLENIQIQKLAKMDLSKVKVLEDSINILFINNCLKFNFSNNQCILCEEGHLFDENLNSCLKFYYKIDGNQGVFD